MPCSDTVCVTLIPEAVMFGNLALIALRTLVIVDKSTLPVAHAGFGDSAIIVLPAPSASSK
jgi:hypothetical protein